MRVIFMGTPDFAVPALVALVEAGHEVVAAYSQPPRPGGRRSTGFDANRTGSYSGSGGSRCAASATCAGRTGKVRSPCRYRDECHPY